MGESHRIVNRDKQEYIEPGNVKESSKVWAVCTGPLSGLLAYLQTQSLATRRLADRPEEGPVEPEHAGRWAGDRVVIVGQDDDSGLYAAVESEAWTEISGAVRAEFNAWVQEPESQL